MEQSIDIALSAGQAISLRDVTKSWGTEPAVDGINIDVQPGTFTVLLGPSGCGKSTSLRIIAGLEHASAGEVYIDGKLVNDLPPSKRNIAMVFQSYALFPHLTVAENILFGLRVRGISKAEQHSRLTRVADLLGLQIYLSRKPSQLSGGQQQRVALGRAIIAEKPVCLMDEPLSNLDAKLRNTMRTEIRDLQQSLGFSMVYVTHDQAEAITMADQVVLMNQGRVEQAGSPREIYEKPASTFVAGFIGTPPMNLIDASDLLYLSRKADNVDIAALDALTIGVRPENVYLAADNDYTGVKATVQHVEYLGADVLLDCLVGESTLLARLQGQTRISPGDVVQLNWKAEQMHYFDRVSGARLAEIPDAFSSVFSL